MKLNLFVTGLSFVYAQTTKKFEELNCVVHLINGAKFMPLNCQAKVDVCSNVIATCGNGTMPTLMATTYGCETTCLDVDENETDPNVCCASFTCKDGKQAENKACTDNGGCIAVCTPDPGSGDSSAGDSSETAKFCDSVNAATTTCANEQPPNLTETAYGCEITCPDEDDKVERCCESITCEDGQQAENKECTPNGGCSAVCTPDTVTLEKCCDNVNANCKNDQTPILTETTDGCVITCPTEDENVPNVCCESITCEDGQQAESKECSANGGCIAVCTPDTNGGGSSGGGSGSGSTEGEGGSTGGDGSDGNDYTHEDDGDLGNDQSIVVGALTPDSDDSKNYDSETSNLRTEDDDVQDDSFTSAASFLKPSLALFLFFYLL